MGRFPKRSEQFVRFVIFTQIHIATACTVFDIIVVDSFSILTMLKILKIPRILRILIFLGFLRFLEFAGFLVS